MDCSRSIADAEPTWFIRTVRSRADQYSLGMAIRVAAWLAAAIFFIVAAFQAALVFGAPWGEYTQGAGRAVHSPPRDGSSQQCRACSRS
jgi:hypothetical protein